MSTQLPETGFVRAKQLLGDKKRGTPPILPIGTTLFWQMVRTGRFPKPTRLGSRTTVWAVSDVREWLASKGAV